MKLTLVATLVPLTFAFLFISICIGNANELQYPPYFFFPTLFVNFVIWTSLLILVQLFFVGRRVFPIINIGVFTLALFMWIQAHVFDWGFGVMDGTTSAIWANYKLEAWYEVIFYLSILGIIYWQRKFMSTIIIPVSCVFLFMQAIPLVLSVFATNVLSDSLKPSSIGYKFTNDNISQLSSEKNVILLVLDSFPQSLAEQTFEDYPELKKIFADFVNYDHFVADKGGTRINIPCMLTGMKYSDDYSFDVKSFLWQPYLKYLKTAYNQDNALAKRLSSLGWEVDMYPEAPYTIYVNPIWYSNVKRILYVNIANWIYTSYEGSENLASSIFFRCLPTCQKESYRWYSGWLCGSIKSILYRMVSVDAIHNEMLLREGWDDPDLWFFNEMTKDDLFKLTARNVFKYIHLNSVHTPHLRNTCFSHPNGYDMTNPLAMGENSLAYGSLKIVGRFLEKMKRSGIYDNSLIMVLGDHCQHESVYYEELYPSYLPDNPYNVPMLFVKLPHEKRKEMEVCSDYVFMQDIPATVLDVVLEKDGRSGLTSNEKTTQTQVAGGKSNNNENQREYVPCSMRQLTPETCNRRRATCEKIFDKEWERIESKIDRGKLSATAAPTIVKEVFSLSCRITRPKSTHQTNEFRVTMSGDQEDNKFDKTFILYPMKGERFYSFAFVTEKYTQTNQENMGGRPLSDKDIVWRYSCILNMDGIADGEYQASVAEPLDEGKVCITRYPYYFSVKTGKITMKKEVQRK